MMFKNAYCLGGNWYLIIEGNKITLIKGDKTIDFSDKKDIWAVSNN